MNHQNQDLSGSPRIALITGSARRVGAQTVRQLHADGLAVIIHYRSSSTEAQALAAELNKIREGSAFTEQCDFAMPSTIEDMAARIASQHGRLDVLVNNASAFFPTPVGEITLETINKLFASNFIAPLLLTQALVPLLSMPYQAGKGSGAVVNMIDVHAQRPYPAHTVYCSAKAALAMQTRSLALELAPAIRFNGVAPGSILWPSSSGGSETPDIDDAQKEKILAGIPMQRNGSPEDIANTISWLVSEKAAYITGQIVAVDGGRSL